jgi:hypothetical protein
VTRQETEAYLAAVDATHRDAFTALCTLIRSADARIDESIKWNAPSFFITDHFATTGLTRDGAIRLVLHTGAKKRPDSLAVAIEDGGFLTWVAPDRAVVTFANLQQVNDAAPTLTRVIRQWIEQTQSVVRR